MSEKLCIFCQNFVYDEIYQEADWSEYTAGGIEGGMRCGAGHYERERPGDTDEFRVILLKAEKCKDYSESSK